MAGATLLLAAFCFFALRSSNGPDFAFLEGAELVDHDSLTVVQTVMPGRAIKSEAWTTWRYETSQEFEVFLKSVWKSLDDSRWQPVLGYDADIVEFTSNEGEHILIAASPYGGKCSFYYSRKSAITDFVGAWLWRTIHRPEPRQLYL